MIYFHWWKAIAIKRYVDGSIGLSSVFKDIRFLFRQAVIAITNNHDKLS